MTGRARLQTSINWAFREKLVEIVGCPEVSEACGCVAVQNCTTGLSGLVALHRLYRDVPRHRGEAIMKRIYSGGCHCGAVRYDVEADLSQGTVKCNCSICSKSRAWLVAVGSADFRLLQGE